MNDIHNSLTVIIPAYNEADNIGDSILSLQAQTLRPTKIIVIDDCSTDDTAKVATNLGVSVVRPRQNTGAKAGAQNVALSKVDTEYVMAIDADTVLEKNAIAKLMKSIENSAASAACGFVIPRYVKTIWERGRYIEYLLGFTYFKTVQGYFERPLVASGCFSVYKTSVLKKMGGWSTRTIAEDMDLTWSLYHRGHGVKYVEDAISYPIDPHTFSLFKTQVRRWTHGYFQNIKLHQTKNLQIPLLNIMTSVSTIDAIISSIVFMILIPLGIIIARMPVLALIYIIDIPLIFPPLIYQAYKRKEALRIITSIPGYVIVRMVNAYMVLEAFVSEIILGRRLNVFIKGH